MDIPWRAATPRPRRGDAAARPPHASSEFGRNSGPNRPSAQVFTRTGSSARRLARLKPGLPILAVTPSVDVARSLALSAYVYPAVLDPEDVDAERSNLFFRMLEAGLELARAKHLVDDPTDRIVCTAGLPFNVEGCANAIRVIEAGGLDCWGGQCTWEG